MTPKTSFQISVSPTKNNDKAKQLNIPVGKQRIRNKIRSETDDQINAQSLSAAWDVTLSKSLTKMKQGTQWIEEGWKRIISQVGWHVIYYWSGTDLSYLYFTVDNFNYSAFCAVALLGARNECRKRFVTVESYCLVV